MSGKQFVVMWCEEGLECVYPVTDIEYETFLCAMQDKKPATDVNHAISTMVLRARYNTQRHYEIYAVGAADGIEREDIEGMFACDPQMGADIIRERGAKIYSDRREEKRVMIR